MANRDLYSIVVDLFKVLKIDISTVNREGVYLTYNVFPQDLTHSVDISTLLDWGYGESEDSSGSVANDLTNIIDDRGESYGDFHKSFEKIAKIWTEILKTPITAGDVGRCMIGLKLARTVASPDHYDSYLDMAAYADLTAKIEDAR